MPTTPNRTLALAALCGCVILSGCGREQAADSAAPPASAPALVLRGPLEHVGPMTREPMVVEHPDGTLFVTGYGEAVPHLSRSTDGGATWSAVNVGTEAAGAVGNSDVDLAIAPDGTLFFVAMSYDRKKYEGTGIAIGASRDAGATWTWTQLSKTRFDDRPWVEVAPDGTAHVIWNDGAGVSYSVSRDAGRTWKEQPRIHDKGHSSHMAVARGGEIAVRITPVSASANKHHEGVDLVAVSTDGGATWARHAVPGQRAWTFPFTEDDPMPRWVEPLAWDAGGALYYLWTDPSSLWLARATDRGAQWTTWRIAEGGGLRYFPYLVARGDGELAASWFSGRGEDLRVHVARIDVTGNGAAPAVTLSEPFTPDSWTFGAKPDAPRKRDTAGEYVPLAFLRDGRLAVVSTIQDDRAKRFGFSWRTADAR